MIYVCNDGSYGIIASSGTDIKEAKIIRIRPIDDASVLNIPLNNLRYKRPMWSIVLRIIIIIVYFGILIWFTSSSYKINNPTYEGTISFALIAIVIAVLSVVRRYRRNSFINPYQTCNKIDNWQKIKSVKYISKRRVGFTNFNIISLNIGNEDYTIALTDKELDRLKQQGIMLI
ncbi:hypothetical protein Calag_1525 [Caldisphaera lagunensis DSM 15908]|uniref:Uncharacterized protein n=1 Tax=Caldisphaera lagunensis (strain DSM 15908 / JCM 11604 / ANMR 0165 / IC-154) TaxID=1056495 RepID=L0ACS2_CALLD|nr:hypothetical protein [Caldisphaera lagunensis]AFZ71224.1 hypothetical protein Calag_1525 [Caldisphaera lagunensis DSM 15908]